jgi:ketosteroid isomerase-like protein
VPPAAPAAPPEPAVSARKEPAARRAVPRSGSERGDISSLLNRWAGSIRSGDARSLARFYAPRISPYYARRSARPADTRQHLEYLRGRYGRLAIYRITGLSIAPVSANMAFATVTKHWETAGPRKQAGEERQRITLVRTDEGWKIAGEEEPRVSWVHRDRPR